MWLYVGDSENIISFREVVSDTVRLIPIEDRANFLVGEVKKILESDSAYFLHDDKAKTIFKVSRTGKALASICRLGGAADEYANLNDFEINIDTEEVYLLCCPKKIIVTDFNLNVKEVIPLVADYAQLALHDSVLYFYGHGRTFFGMDIANRKVSEILSEKVLPQLYGYTYGVFHKTGGKLLYVSHGSDCVYELEDGEAKVLFVLDFKDKARRYARLAENRELKLLEIATAFPPKLNSIFETATDEYTLLYTHDLRVCVCRLNIGSSEVLYDGIETSSAGSIVSNEITDRIVAYDFVDLNDLSASLLSAYHLVPESVGQAPTEDPNPTLIIYKLRK